MTAAPKPYREPRPKRTKPPGQAPLTKITIGGVEVTVEQTIEAFDVLKASTSIMVAQPLRKAGNPLAACDYHLVANDERKLPGSERLATKPAFLKAIAKLVGR